MKAQRDAGSHTCVCLIEAGAEVTLIDNLSNSFKEVLNRLKILLGDAFARITFREVSPVSDTQVLCDGHIGISCTFPCNTLRSRVWAQLSCICDGLAAIRGCGPASTGLGNTPLPHGAAFCRSM